MGLEPVPFNFSSLMIFPTCHSVAIPPSLLQLLHLVVSEGMDFWNKRLRDVKKTFELLGISQQVILKMEKHLLSPTY